MIITKSLSRRGNTDSSMYGLGHLAARHMPGEPVGPPAWLAATSNIKGGSSGPKDRVQGPLAREGRLYSDKYLQGL